MILRPVLAFSYKCPYCGLVTSGRMNLFSPKKQMRFPCACGQSAMTLHAQDGGLRAEIPCAYCCERHSAVFEPEALWRHGLQGVFCRATGFSTCYAGKPADVDACADRYEPSVGELVAGLMASEAERDSDGPVPPSVVAGALGAVRELAYAGLVHCSCGSRRFSLRFDRRMVELSCASCGAAAILPAAKDSDVEAIRRSEGICLHADAPAEGVRPGSE